MIAITMTATRRPELLERTLGSFKQHVWSPLHDWKLILNIDPVGHKIPSIHVLDAAREYFDDITCLMPRQPSFPKAFIWTWTYSYMAEYVFHIEEDWEFLRPIELDEMIGILNDTKDLALLRLPMFRSSEAHMKNWSHFYPFNGQYFECPADKRIELGFCGHPTLLRGEFVRRTTPLLLSDRNPEKQFHRGHPLLMEEIPKWRYGVFGKPNQGPAIRDIGREWMVEHGWAKEGNKAHFTQWTKV